MFTTAPEGQKHWPRSPSEVRSFTLELVWKGGAGQKGEDSHYPWP